MQMILNFRSEPVEFGRVFNGSGAFGFFGDDHVRSPDPATPELGEPYWYCRVYGMFGWNVVRGLVTFTSKTATLRPRLSPELKRGNLLLKEDGLHVAERFPDCIRLFPGRGHGLNAVGLSNPGWKILLESGRWQQRRQPFKLSFMPEGDTPHERADEMEEALKVLRHHLPQFQAPFALEINPLCPNAPQEQLDAITETIVWGAMARPLGVPVLVKLNQNIRPEHLDEYMKTTHVHGVIMGNAINWHASGQLIDRKKYFGTETSPLAKYGGGAISGDPLFHPLMLYLHELKERGVYRKPLIASGGINSTANARQALKIGGPVAGIEMATAFVSHPWRIEDIIDETTRYFEGLEA